MLNKQKIYRSILLVILSLGLLIHNHLYADPVIIHHPDLKDEDFTRASLVRIYAMQKKMWSNGIPIKVYMFANSNPIHKQFVLTHLKMQPYQLNRLWHRLLFSGTGAIPQEVASIELMLENIKSTPGAIGYIDSKDEKPLDERVIERAADE